MDSGRSVSLTPLTPLRFLGRAASVHPDRVAIVDGDRSFTYEKFAATATRLAWALRESGVEAGDRVAFLSPNSAEMLIAHFGVPLAGGVLVPINTRLSAPEIAYICEHSGARLLFVDDQLIGGIEPILDELGSVEQVVVVGGPEVAGTTAYDAFLKRGKDSPLPWEVEDELATISINYTSGTTGRPKGVMYSHRGATINALNEVAHSGFTADSVYLWTLPMFHCNGWCTTWAATAAGARHVCLRAVRGDEAWSLIGSEQVTHLNGAPTVLSILADDPAAAPLDRPLTVTTAGAAPSPTILGRFEQLGARVVHVYGLTETYGPYSVCERQDDWSSLAGAERARLMARQGVGMLLAERLRVVDEEMNDVPADAATIGEIVMRGNNVMKGYFADEEATAEAFRGGWFHSGDLGVMHPDGYVQLVDRAKDVVISGGENISTIEVENSLLSHPAVADVAVIGVPDEKWGERPKAFVVLAAEGSVGEDALIHHVREQLARFKAPREVAFLEALPRTSTGKVQKYELREREWSDQALRIKG
jgi:fatty-acyl-CoA synthase